MLPVAVRATEVSWLVGSELGRFFPLRLRNGARRNTRQLDLYMVVQPKVRMNVIPLPVFPGFAQGSRRGKDSFWGKKECFPFRPQS